MKPVLNRTVQFLEILVLLLVLASLTLVMGGKGLEQKRKLLEKKACLEREQRALVMDIEALERTVRLLRTDPAMLERAAKCKLGMARRNETVYLFASGNQSRITGLRHTSLIRRNKSP